MSPRYKIKSTMTPGFNPAGQFGIKPTAAIPKEVLEEREIGVRRKVREDKRALEQANGIFRCSICRKIFNSKAKLLGHIRFAHQRDDLKKEIPTGGDTSPSSSSSKSEAEIKQEEKKEINNKEVGENKDNKNHGKTN